MRSVKGIIAKSLAVTFLAVAGMYYSPKNITSAIAPLPNIGPTEIVDFEELKTPQTMIVNSPYISGNFKFEAMNEKGTIAGKFLEVVGAFEKHNNAVPFDNPNKFTDTSISGKNYYKIKISLSDNHKTNQVFDLLDVGLVIAGSGSAINVEAVQIDGSLIKKDLEIIPNRGVHPFYLGLQRVKEVTISGPVRIASINAAVPEKSEKLPFLAQSEVVGGIPNAPVLP